MVTYYTVLLTIHVLAAITWVGSNISTAIQASRVQSRSAAELGQFGKDADWYGMRVLAPTSLVLIVTGVLLAIEGDWGFDEPWILFALAAWLFSFVLGIAFLGPQSAKAGRLIEASDGQATPEWKALVDRLFLVSRIELVVLIAVVIDMVIKPGA